MLIFAVGFERAGAKLSNSIAPPTLPLVGVVQKPPQLRGSSQLIEMRVGQQRVVLVKARRFPGWRYGDQLRISGGQVRNKIIYYPRLEFISGDAGNVLLTILFKWRERLESLVEQVMVEPQASLAIGILLGIERGFSRDLYDGLRRVGLIHIIVASGYNVSILIGLLASLKAWLGKSFTVLITLIVIVGYVIMVGLEPPVIRAAIMGGASLLAVLVGRQKHALLWLVFAAIVMLMLDPLLYQSLSFQLSFGATLGILVFQDRIARLLRLFPRIIRGDLATTLSAQLFTVPLIWFRLGRFAPNGLLANVLTLWVIPNIMWGSLLSISVGFISLDVARLVNLPVHYLIQYMLWVVEALG